MTTVISERRRRVATAPVVAVMLLVVAAWAALVAWGASPYARYLDHGGLDGAGLDGAPLAGVMIGGWTLMVVAMMVPTVLPLVRMVGDIGERRGSRIRLTSALLVGYLAVWVAAGSAAWTGDAALHAIEDRSDLLSSIGWTLGPAALALATVFQLSSLKDRCLRECRSPRGLLLSRWRGRQPALESLMLGAAHGRYCLGCCWALMLVMFAVGGGNLGLMFALGAVMAAEKNLPRGDALTRPVAAALAVATIASVAVRLG